MPEWHWFNGHEATTRDQRKAATMNLAPKLFVLDTNVVLHDARSILAFEENDIAIPITVLEELDRFKRGNEDIHHQAREFLRILDDLSDSTMTCRDVPLGVGLGKIRVVLDVNEHPGLTGTFMSD